MAELEEGEGEILEYYEDDELEEEEECDEDDEILSLSLDTSTDNLQVLSPMSKEEQLERENDFPSSSHDDHLTSTNDFYTLTQRNHKLERERRELVDQLASLKESSLYSEHTLTSDVSLQIIQITEKHSKEMEHLKRELHQVELERESSEGENTYLKSRLEILEEEKELLSEELVRSQEAIQMQLKRLQEKTIEYNACENNLAKSERKVHELKKQLVEDEENRRLVMVSKQRLMAYQELEQSHRHLDAENKMLRERTDNIELLTYQLQSLREKVSQLESEQETCQKLQAENQILQEKLDVFVVGESSQNSSPLLSPSLMRLQLVHLQQKEVVLTTECSDLKTQLKIKDNSLCGAQNEITRLKEDLEKRQSEIENKIDTIQKLERRVKFVTKERDGVVNVLNSYKLDGGADSVLKEQVTELEASNERLNTKILEQAHELEMCYTQLELATGKTVKLTQES